MIAWVHSVPDDERIGWLVAWVLCVAYVRWASRLKPNELGEMPYKWIRLGGSLDLVIISIALMGLPLALGCHTH